MGINIRASKNSISISSATSFKKSNIITKPYPGFPTDLQAQLMVLMTQAKGVSIIKEDIFERKRQLVFQKNKGQV